MAESVHCLLTSPGKRLGSQKTPGEERAYPSLSGFLSLSSGRRCQTGHTALTFMTLLRAGIIACAAVASLCHSGDGTQGTVCAKQAFYQVSTSPASQVSLFHPQVFLVAL